MNRFHIGKIASVLINIIRSQIGGEYSLILILSLFISLLSMLSGCQPTSSNPMPGIKNVFNEKFLIGASLMMNRCQVRIQIPYLLY